MLWERCRSHTTCCASLASPEPFDRRFSDGRSAGSAARTGGGARVMVADARAVSWNVTLGLLQRRYRLQARWIATHALVSRRKSDMPYGLGVATRCGTTSDLLMGGL